MFFLLLVRMSFYQTEGEGTTPAFKSPVEALSVKLGKEKLARSRWMTSQGRIRGGGRRGVPGACGSDIDMGMLA